MGIKLIILFIVFCIIMVLISLEKRSNDIEDESWEEATSLYEMSVQEALLIIDDAECNGFEVKRVGTKLYFRELK